MERTRHSEPSGRTWTILYLIAVVAVLYLARPVLVPFALAVLLTFVVAPLATWVERVVRSRALAVGIVTIGVIGLFAGGAVVVGQQFVGFADDLPSYRATIVRKVRAIEAGPGKLFGRTAEMVRGIGVEIAGKPAEGAAAEPADPAAPQPPPSRATPSAEHSEPGAKGPAPAPEGSAAMVLGILQPLAQPLAAGAIVILLLVIMLMSRESIRDRLIRLAGLQQIGLTTQMLEEAGVRVGSYLRAQLLVNTVYGLVIGVGLLLIGIPNAPLCGLVAGVARFIPIVGPWLGAAIPAVLSLAVFEDWYHLLLVAGLFASLEALNNAVLEPRLYGSSTGMSSFGVVVAVIFWTWVWGGVGLVLAVPITACLIVFSRQVPRLGAVSILLGDEPALADSERFYQRLLCKNDDEAAAILAVAPREHDPADTLDDIVISGLAAARADRRRGLITATQIAAIASAAADVAGEWLTDVEGQPASAPVPSARAVFIPIGDELDEVAAGLLAHLFRSEGVEAEIAHGALLVAEQINLAAAPGVGVIVVCGVGPPTQAQTARICKALRRRIPQRPVLLVAWESDPTRPALAAGDPAAPYATVDTSRAAVRTALAILGTTPTEPTPAPAVLGDSSNHARLSSPRGLKNPEPR